MRGLSCVGSHLHVAISSLPKAVFISTLLYVLYSGVCTVLNVGVELMFVLVYVFINILLLLFSVSLSMCVFIV